MPQPDPNVFAQQHPGVSYVPTQSSSRKSDNKGAIVRINNVFPAETRVMMSANARFYFKKADDSDDGSEDVLHGDAKIPCDSVLVFKPTESKIVGGFDIKIRLLSANLDEVRDISAGDPGAGLCWSRAEFDCGPDQATN